MHELLDFLSKTPGPWAVGFETYTEESDELTAGSFYAICNNYSLNSDHDCVSFVQGEEGKETGQVVLPLPPLTLVSNEEGTMVFQNANLNVAVEGFETKVLVYVKSL